MDSPQYFERLLVAAADIQGDIPPSLVADRPEELLASVPATAAGTPASREQLLAALEECERRGWLILMKVFGPWRWGLTATGFEAAQAVRVRLVVDPFQPTVTQANPPASASAASADINQRLLQAVFDVFVQSGHWPTLQHLRRVVNWSGDSERVLNALPPGLLIVDRPIQDESTVKLTISGVARCRGSEAITEAFIWLLRFLVSVEAAYQPPSPTEATFPKVTSADALKAWERDYPGRSRQDLDLAFLLTDPDQRLWGRGKSITAAGEWEITVDSRIRAYASVSTLEQYIGIVAVGGLPKKESTSSGSQAPVPEIDYRGDVARFSPDASWGRDELGFEAEVNAFTDLLLSRQVVPPMCVGLFGPWGSGKSFFMGKLIERARAVSLAARFATHDDPLMTLCARVVHVRFNAWTYAEANLYASLAATILSELASTLSESGAAHEKERSKLLAVLKSAQETSDAASARADNAKAVRNQAAKDAQHARERASAAQTDLLARTLAEFRQADPGAQPATSLLSSALGASESSLRLGDVSNLAAAPSSIIAFALLIRRIGWRSLGRVALGILWPMVVAVFLLVGILFLNQQFAAITSVPTIVIAIVAGLELAKGLQRDIVNAARMLLEREQIVADQSEAGEMLREAEADLHAAQGVVDATQAELHRFVTSETGSMYRFVLDRYAEGDYQKQLGLVSRLHGDLTELSKLLAKPTSESGLPHVERIVLYIDDLDRCPASTVLAVLQAVNLLLALPLFVVVIGVDARWLYSCIERSNTIGGESPHRYVEKIIQIPFWLRRMDSDAYQRLISAAVDDNPDQGFTDVGVPLVVPGPGSSEPIQLGEPAPRPQPVLERPKMTGQEVNMLQRLVGFAPTPRAGKRLVNIYRLLRALVGPAARARLEAGEYQTVLIQLALLSGFPEHAPLLFDRVHAASGDDFWLVVEQWRRLTTGSNRFGTPSSELAIPPASQLRDLQDALLALQGTVDIQTDTFLAWSPITSRFSFTIPN